MHQIVDVSWPQGAYHPGAEEAVFVAATSGDGGTLFVQSTFAEDVALARAAGKALGFYHFNGAEDAAASADAFWAAVRAYFRAGDLPALDIESFNGGTHPAQSPAWAAAFLARLSALSGIPAAALRLGIYGNRSDMRAPGWGALERAGCWLWLAAPGGYPENTPIGEWSHWTILQYDSAGNLDRDESELTFAQIAGALTTAALAVTTLQEDIMKIPTFRDGNGSGSIYTIAPDLTIDGITGDEYSAGSIAGALEPWVQAPDGLAVQILARRTARLRAAQHGDQAALAQQVSALVIPAVLAGLQGAGAAAPTQAQIQAACESALKDVFATAAK